MTITNKNKNETKKQKSNQCVKLENHFDVRFAAAERENQQSIETLLFDALETLRTQQFAQFHRENRRNRWLLSNEIRQMNSNTFLLWLLLCTKTLSECKRLLLFAFTILN